MNILFEFPSPSSYRTPSAESGLPRAPSSALDSPSLYTGTSGVPPSLHPSSPWGTREGQGHRGRGQGEVWGRGEVRVHGPSRGDRVVGGPLDPTLDTL